MIAYLATLPPGVVMRDLQIRAATKGPFARDAATAASAPADQPARTDPAEAP